MKSSTAVLPLLLSDSIRAGSVAAKSGVTSLGKQKLQKLWRRIMLGIVYDILLISTVSKLLTRPLVWFPSESTPWTKTVHFFALV